MSALKRALELSAADMRIGIIDACESGATRDKGGRRGPSFCSTSTIAMKRAVSCSSARSAANETSQESDDPAALSSRTI